MKKDAFVSVVLVVDGPIDHLVGRFGTLAAELAERYTDYEIVVVRHGPVEASSDQQTVEAILATLCGIRWIQLSSHVHSDVAWAAAMENAIGDFVVMFDLRQDPLSSIWETVALCQSGFDIVVGVAVQPRTTAYSIGRVLADSLLAAAGYSLPRDSTTLRCVSRRTVNAVTRTGRFHHQLYMRIHKSGYPQAIYKYSIDKDGMRSRSLVSGARKLVYLLVFNSSAPLRWMSMLGALGSMAAFAFAAYSLGAHFICGSVVEGWTTTILFMSVLFLTQFVMLAFFGEYLGRLLDDRSEQADYAVVFEKTSARMIRDNRVNVTDESIPRRGS